MPRLSSRSIQIYYQAPQVSQQEIERIYKYWNLGVALSLILRRCQLQCESRDGKALSYVDIYTILYHGMKNGHIKERSAGDLAELPIKDFPDFYKTWKEGGTLEECIESISKTGRDQASKAFLTNLFRTMGDRYRDEQRRKLEGTLQTVVVEKSVDDKLLQTILSHSLRTTITVSGRPHNALVIFLDKLPLKVMEAIQEAQTEAGKELAILANPSLQTNQQMAASASKATASMPMKKDEIERCPESNQELATLSAPIQVDSEEVAASLESQAVSLKIRSANNPELDSVILPSELSLDNLLDDDSTLPPEEHSP